MKKFIATAVAASALAVCGAASAQDLGSIIASVLGFNQTYNQTVYQDQFGRQFYYDQYGRQVYIQAQAPRQVLGYDAWGRPVYNSSYAYNGQSWDRDGDGVSNSRDRFPDDPRFW